MVFKKKDSVPELLADPSPISKTKKNYFQMLREELKDDPEAMKQLIPVPDYGALNSILLMKVLEELRKNEKN